MREAGSESWAVAKLATDCVSVLNTCVSCTKARRVSERVSWYAMRQCGWASVCSKDAASHILKPHPCHVLG